MDAVTTDLVGKRVTVQCHCGEGVTAEIGTIRALWPEASENGVTELRMLVWLDKGRFYNCYAASAKLEIWP